MAPLSLAHGSAEVDAIVREAEARAGTEYRRLIEYRREVEAGAFDETMRLCAGYRRARGLGRGPTAGQAAGKWRAWARIFKEGLDQPFSILDGTKGEFITANHLRMWQLDSWLRSVHTLYLIHSDGFRAAARQCLADVRRREVDWFALSIVNADVAGSLTAEFASGAGVAQLFSLVRRSTAWAWRPVLRVAEGLRARITKPMITVAGLTILPIAGANALEYLETVRRGARGARDFVGHMDEEQLRLKSTARKLLMAKAIKLLGDGLDKDDLTDFEAWAVANVRADDRARAHEDYARIRGGGPAEPGDAAYGSVLKAILPVLDQLNLGS